MKSQNLRWVKELIELKLIGQNQHNFYAAAFDKAVMVEASSGSSGII
jgi:hypothetical protein